MPCDAVLAPGHCAPPRGAFFSWVEAPLGLDLMLLATIVPVVIVIVAMFSRRKGGDDSGDDDRHY